MKYITLWTYINTMKRTPIPVGTSHSKHVDWFKPDKSLLLLWRLKSNNRPTVSHRWKTL